MAGKAGKCPHCQTRFLVPQLELDEPEPMSEPAPASFSSASIPPFAPPPAPGGAVAAGPPRSDTITFICPNGHKLSGPPTLRGKLGLCPHCQSRFRIPASEETSSILTTPAGQDSLSQSGSTEISSAPTFSAGPPSPSSIAKQGTTTGLSKPAATAKPAPPVFTPPPPPPPGKSKPAGAKSPPPFLDEVPPAEILDDDPGEVGGDSLDSAASATDDAPHAELLSAWQAPPPPAAPNPSRWYELFGWFWSQRDARSVVDLRLKGGQVFQPAWYAASLSDSHFGVFGTQADDGAYDISLVPWDQIERVDVRGCEELPPNRFE